MDAAPAGPPDRFRMLFVCTGNICRSPFAQFHTRFLLEGRLGPWRAGRIQTASAGTGAVVGSGMHALTRPQLTSRRDHPDVAAFRARQLPDRDVTMADLVLTMTAEHRSRVLGDVPQALRYTFTLREFARLVAAADRRGLPADPAERGRALVAAALAVRGTLPRVPPEDDDVPDPIGGEEADHAAATAVIDTAVRTVVDALVPPPGPPPPPPAPVPAARGWSGPPPGPPGPHGPPVRPAGDPRAVPPQPTTVGEGRHAR